MTSFWRLFDNKSKNPIKIIFFTLNTWGDEKIYKYGFGHLIKPISKT